MDSNDIIEQEEAFHKLNAEIELKTRQLMKNVEAVVNKNIYPKNWSPDYLGVKCGREKKEGLIDERSPYDYLETDIIPTYITDRTYKSPLSSASRKGKSRGTSPKNLNKSELKEGAALIPACAKGMSAESLSRFLKAKGKLLQEELEHVKRELQIKTEECKKTHQELRNRDEEKLKITNEMTGLREKVKKLASNAASLEEKLKLRDSENNLLKKEVDMLKTEIKKLTFSASGHETKLNKAKEENEKLKFLLKQADLNEKETRDKYRVKNEEMQSSLRKLEKDKNELINAIKKQVVLIENLKKQKGLLEVEGCLKFTEKEFLKLLEGRGEESG